MIESHLKTMATAVRMKYVRFLLTVKLCLTSLCFSQEKIKNPYFDTRRWKVWLLDDTPVTVQLPGPRQAPEKSEERTFQMPPVSERLYPCLGGPFISFSPQVHPATAGFADDVYFNWDKKHAYLRDSWPAGENPVFSGLLKAIIHDTDLDYGWPPRTENYPDILHRIGVNFVNQSTTEVAHDITNSSSHMQKLESLFYFANILFAAPAHISFMDRQPNSSVDKYEALVPCFFNSVGSSGSETMALVKMILAASYLPEATKILLKQNGLYASTLLYLWKAALPYHVPYDNELRHRVAYNSSGDHRDYRGSNQTEVNENYHNYDELQHLKNMVSLASKMKQTPPVALLKLISVSSGQLIYACKTAILLHHNESAGNQIEPVHLLVSGQESYDLFSRPLRLRWKILYGDTGTKIIERGNSIYEIIVPGDPCLPRGRTAIALIASNGLYDSNPAIISVYRKYGSENLRPVFLTLEEKTVLPGETVNWPLLAADPEGFPVRFYRWSNQVGELKGNLFFWSVPVQTPAQSFPLNFIVSDGCSGNSYNSQVTFLHVSPTVAEISCPVREGIVPFTVKFSAQGSRDRKKGPLKFIWDFDDGNTSTEFSPSHTFTRPGFYQVSLTVSGPSGSHTAKTIIHAHHQWLPAINCGWSGESLDERIWSKIPGTETAVSVVKSSPGHFLRLYQPRAKKTLFGIRTVKKFAPPLYLEVVFQHYLDASQPGTGLEICGSLWGHIPGDTSGRSVGFGFPQGNEEKVWHFIPLCQKVRFPWAYTQLRMYITDDLKHPGKVRYTGWLHTDKESRFFILDNQESKAEPLGIVSTSPDNRLEIYCYQVWSPEGGYDGPVIKVQGNGENLEERMPQKIQEKACCFLLSDSFRKKTSFSFTIFNAGSQDLCLGETPVSIQGKDAEFFQIISWPKKVIPAGSKTSFTVQFHPGEKTYHTVRIAITSNDSARPQTFYDLYGLQPAFIQIPTSESSLPRDQQGPP